MADLRSTVAGEVRFDAGSRALYATDSSNYRHVAIGVVIPRTTEDVIATVATCHRYQVPILSRGGGSALLAAGIAVGGAAIGAFARQRSML